MIELNLVRLVRMLFRILRILIKLHENIQKIFCQPLYFIVHFHHLSSQLFMFMFRCRLK